MKRGVLLLGLAAWFVFAACRGGSEQDRQREIQHEMDRYEMEVEARLDSIEVRIQSLKRDVAERSGEAKVQIEAEIDDLERRRMDLEVRLRGLANATEVSWNRMRVELDRDLEELQRAYDRIRQEL